jgi:hypothetical protein
VDAGNDVLANDIHRHPHRGAADDGMGWTRELHGGSQTAPRFNVAIALSSSMPSEGAVSPESISRSPPANWNAPQTVVVTGQQDDGTMDGNVIYTNPDFAGIERRRALQGNGSSPTSR